MLLRLSEYVLLSACPSPASSSGCSPAPWSMNCALVLLLEETLLLSADCKGWAAASRAGGAGFGAATVNGEIMLLKIAFRLPAQSGRHVGDNPKEGLRPKNLLCSNHCKPSLRPEAWSQHTRSQAVPWRLRIRVWCSKEGLETLSSSLCSRSTSRLKSWPMLRRRCANDKLSCLYSNNTFSKLAPLTVGNVSMPDVIPMFTLLFCYRMLLKMRTGTTAKCAAWVPLRPLSLSACRSRT